METNHINSTAVPSFFIQEHSMMIRIWHWLTFIVISGIILTVLINSTLTNQRKNIPMVQEQLKSRNIIVTEDQAFAVTREYEDKFWNVHKLLGYGLAFLLISRVIIELHNPVRKRFVYESKMHLVCTGRRIIIKMSTDTISELKPVTCFFISL